MIGFVVLVKSFKPFQHHSLFHKNKIRVHKTASRCFRCCTSAERRQIGFVGIQHAGILVENTERALNFYTIVLGMEDASMERPNLPYKGAFIRVGPQQQIHLMELPSVDPKTGRPVHGGRDRHIALEVENLSALVERLEQMGHPFTYSMSGRKAIFCRDCDGNALEFMERNC
ncbi:glyoxalase I family protein [Galdieria sulphuraria]|uniref:Glyoxalase I family protein n=1 Tax=Galdieria sulphuraria TaxID=130081 RepID=M2WVT8_GALSU|nr:glyoxalase I family protein [Galdieria sulphuraria]EME28105.1 glyoxalase I family protein [Galdieria sulphuraria]|eukprot:XP_005704625.1 glyoxalase I family protein [Galdieria sulphuraria]